MLYLVKIPHSSDGVSNEAMASVLKGLHAANQCRQSVELILANRSGQVRYFLRCPPSLKAILLVHLLDAYPGTSLERVSDSEIDQVVDGFTTTFVPTYDFLPLRRSIERHDPLTGLLSVLNSSSAQKLAAVVTLRIQPATKSQVTHARTASEIFSRRCVSSKLKQRLACQAVSTRLADRVIARTIARAVTRVASAVPDAEKLKTHLFGCTIEVTLKAEASNELAQQKLTDISGVLSLFSTDENSFELAVGARKRKRSVGLLTPNELSLLWHPVASEVRVSKLQRTKLTELEPPIQLPSPQRERRFTPIGRVVFRNDQRIVGLTLDSLRRHVYISGKTGVGKSSLMLSMIRENLHSGIGIGLIDPHGDLYQSCIDQIPRSRTNQVILFDPSRTEQLVTFNPLDLQGGLDPSRVADGVLSAFVKIFGLDTASAPRLLHIFRNALATMVEQPDATLIGINRLLTDASYRKAAVSPVSNPAVREFWRSEFGRWHPRDRAMFLGSLQNKLGAFLSNRQLQLILGQPRSSFSLRKVMDQRMIILCNLSKGRLGEDAANLLGALMLSSLQLAGESRAAISEWEREDFVCYVDEVQNYATTGLATALSEARKYRAPLLVLANQFRDQLSPDLRSAIVGNCGSVVTFQVGSEDARFWHQYFGTAVTEASLMNLPKYHAIANMLIDGMPSGPMTIRTLPPKPGHSDFGRRIEQQSLRQFARPVSQLSASVEEMFV